MARVHDPFDPVHMTIEERLEELGDLLAKAMLRLHRGSPAHVDVLAAKESPESERNCLDDGAEKRLHGPRG